MLPGQNPTQQMNEKWSFLCKIVKIFWSQFIAVKSFKNISQRVSGWMIKPSLQVFWLSQAKIDGTSVHCFCALSFSIKTNLDQRPADLALLSCCTDKLTGQSTPLCCCQFCCKCLIFLELSKPGFFLDVFTKIKIWMAMEISSITSR